MIHINLKIDSLSLKVGRGASLGYIDSHFSVVSVRNGYPLSIGSLLHLIHDNVPTFIPDPMLPDVFVRLNAEHRNQASCILIVSGQGYNILLAVSDTNFDDKLAHRFDLSLLDQIIKYVRVL